MYYYMGYYGLLGIVWMVLFWAAVIWLVLWVIRRVQSPQDPLETLRMRYAKGELTTKRYEQMKLELRK